MAFPVSSVLKGMETKGAGGVGGGEKKERETEEVNLLLGPFNRSAIIQGS